MAIDRCYCLQIRFSDLKALAEKSGAGVDSLSKATGCGTGCGLCIPYIRVMLKTGQTDLPVLSPVEVNRLLAAPGSAPRR